VERKESLSIRLNVSIERMMRSSNLSYLPNPAR
jgi:hypothetical protein